jgi:hypothetical protein
VENVKTSGSNTFMPRIKAAGHKRIGNILLSINEENMVCRGVLLYAPCCQRAGHKGEIIPFIPAAELLGMRAYFFKPEILRMFTR